MPRRQAIPAASAGCPAYNFRRFLASCPGLHCPAPGSTIRLRRIIPDCQDFHIIALSSITAWAAPGHHGRFGGVGAAFTGSPGQPLATFRVAGTGAFAGQLAIYFPGPVGRFNSAGSGAALICHSGSGRSTTCVSTPGNLFRPHSAGRRLPFRQFAATAPDRLIQIAAGRVSGLHLRRHRSRRVWRFTLQNNSGIRV